VSSGSNFTCGITTAPLLYCWGNNQFGQLGNGTFGNSNVPVKVLGQP
jgi:alpha-tubulin suppressor-like RCC1 family protein